MWCVCVCCGVCAVVCVVWCVCVCVCGVYFRAHERCVLEPLEEMETFRSKHYLYWAGKFPLCCMVDTINERYSALCYCYWQHVSVSVDHLQGFVAIESTSAFFVLVTDLPLFLEAFFSLCRN